MSVDPFERLLGSMPQIAEAVNAFQSEEVQRQVFAALLKTWGGTIEHGTDTVPDQPSRNGHAPDGATAVLTKIELPKTAPPKTASPKTRSTRRTGGKKSWTATKGINFFPEKGVSFRTFAEEKQPVSNYDKYAVAGYYLTEHLGRQSFTAEDLLAAFKVCSWKAPTDPGNILAKVGSLKGWFDTTDTSAVVMSHLGKNMVEHDMPSRLKK